MLLLLTPILLTPTHAATSRMEVFAIPRSQNTSIALSRAESLDKGSVVTGAAAMQPIKNGEQTDSPAVENERL